MMMTSEAAQREREQFRNITGRGEGEEDNDDKCPSQ